MAAISAGSASFTQFAPGVNVMVAASAAAIVFATGLGLGSGSSLVSLRKHLES
jgi:adenine/guanine phosphoribosyltransferase-like PRPP-binding protein